MSGIAIMTDSNCGIMPAEGEKLGIHVLPMPVIINGKTYYEGSGHQRGRIVMTNRYPARIFPHPSPLRGTLFSMWRELLHTHDEVIFIPMSSGLSNTCQTALMLAGEEDLPGVSLWWTTTGYRHPGAVVLRCPDPRRTW